MLDQVDGSFQDLRFGWRWGQSIRGESRSDGKGGSGMITISEELAALMKGPSKLVVDGALVGALVGGEVGDLVAGAKVGDSVVCIEGLAVGQVPQISRQTSFAGPVSLWEWVFFSQIFLILRSGFDASQLQDLYNGLPFFILKKKLSVMTSLHSSATGEGFVGASLGAVVGLVDGFDVD